MIGALAGVLAGGWASWLAAILCGVLMTAASRRLSALIGAALVVAFVTALVADSIPLTAALAILSVAMLLFGSLAAISAWQWAFGRPAETDGTALDDSGTGAPRPEGHAASLGPVRPETPRGAGVGTDTTPLPSSQVERLARLAERDTASFRSALGELSAGQRQQVRQALSERRQRTTDDAS